MRVPTLSIYKQSTYQLNRLANDLNEVNEQVSTGCEINCCSDDPSGMAKVLDINSSLCCLTQCEANLYQGQTVLTSAETALDAMADQLIDINLLCSQLANASAATDDRTDAADNLMVYIDQILDLANTQAYGGYVFGGDQNQIVPFSYDDADDPTGVTYCGGGSAVCVKTGQDTVMALDCLGCDLFYEDEIVVDNTNNQIVFEEDPGTGEEDILTIDAVVPDGTYTRAELAEILEDTMTEASLEDGYGIGYEVGYDADGNCFSVGTDGTYAAEMTTTLTAYHTETVRISNLAVEAAEAETDEETEADYSDAEIEILTPSVLTEYTPEPEGSEPVTFTYTEDGTWTVENDPGYGLPAEIDGNGELLEIDVNDDGVTDIQLDLNEMPEAGMTVSFDIVAGFENTSILPDLGFDGETVSVTPVVSSSTVAETFTVVEGENDAIDFTETLVDEDEASIQLTAVIEPGDYGDPESYAAAVEDALETASADSGNRINYAVTYDADSQTFLIREDTDTGRQLTSFELLFETGTHAGQSAASDLGFEATDIDSGPVWGVEATWSIFDTLFDIEAALADDDVDGLLRAMTRLDTHYDSITSATASVGIAYSSLCATESNVADTEDTLTTMRSEVRDADAVEAIMTLESTQVAYEAALSSCSTIMGLSLVDYM